LDERSTRRHFFMGTAAASAAVLLRPALPALAADDEAKLYAAAKKEGTVTWWTAHVVEAAAEKLRDAFMKKYPGVDVQLTRQTAQVLYQRLQTDLKAGVHELDVFGTTDEGHCLDLKKQNALAAYVPDGVKYLPAAFQKFDPDGMYFLGSFFFVLLNYNPKKITPAPSKWADLTDPKMMNLITLGHPAFSGAVGAWALAMNDKFGWDYMNKVAANKPKINRSIFDTVTDIVAGERFIGAGPDSQTFEQRAVGASIAGAFPSDFSVLAAGPTTVLKDAPHPNAARLLASFYMTKEFSQTLAQTYNFPLRADVPTLDGLTFDKIKYYRNPSARLEAGIPEVVAKWRETFGV
jgi:iron(III) transport system substrate-binding protein